MCPYGTKMIACLRRLFSEVWKVFRATFEKSEEMFIPKLRDM
jgi:hypothetical protein